MHHEQNVELLKYCFGIHPANITLIRDIEKNLKQIPDSPKEGDITLIIDDVLQSPRRARQVINGLANLGLTYHINHYLALGQSERYTPILTEEGREAILVTPVESLELADREVSPSKTGKNPSHL